MSAQPAEEPAEPVISALEAALREALEKAARQRVIACIVAALPVDPDEVGSRPDAPTAGKVQKVSVSMPAGLADLVRSRTGAGGFSKYVSEAVREQVTHDLLGDLLDELEREHGPVPQQVREQTRRMWPDQADE